MPRFASSGCACTASFVHSTAPKRRGSRSRSTRSPSTRSKWSCFCAGVPGASMRRLPDMPRCRIRWPSPQSTSRYLPRRSTARIARRAVEVANQGRLNDLALDAAKTWYEIEPQSAAALSVVASLLVSARKVDEAEPYLAKLLNTEGVDQERGYLQINRLLAGNPDKRSNLRVVQKLASRHPELAPAHFATAQAAALADDEPLALSETRRAAEIRPEWEGPAMLEAQILQKRSTAQAAKRLADFVAKNPQSRGGRLAYARALVADKRTPEARKQLEAVLTANPGDTELVYTVGVLAL